MVRVQHGPPPSASPSSSPVQDIGLSRRRQGFKSPWGRHLYKHDSNELFIQPLEFLFLSLNRSQYCNRWRINPEPDHTHKMKKPQSPKKRKRAFPIMEKSFQSGDSPKESCSMIHTVDVRVFGSSAVVTAKINLKAFVRGKTEKANRFGLVLVKTLWQQVVSFQAAAIPQQ